MVSIENLKNNIAKTITNQTSVACYCKTRIKLKGVDLLGKSLFGLKVECYIYLYHCYELGKQSNSTSSSRPGLLVHYDLFVTFARAITTTTIILSHKCPINGEHVLAIVLTQKATVVTV